MMRPSVALLATIATVMLALSPGAQARSSSPPDRAAGAGPSGRAAGSPAPRTAALTLAPARSDLALAELRFPHSAGRALTSRALRLAVRSRFGSDYLTFAASRHPGRAGARALVLLVNRPSALPDPAQVRVRIAWSRALGAVVVRRMANVLARGMAQPRAALCDLPLHGLPLAPADLRPLGARGTALTGFDAAAAIAAAYDAGCGLAYPSAFRQAVQGPGGTGCGGGATQQGTLCCPPNAMCAPPPSPEPVPPAPRPPPGCPPCNPRPGYACPLIAQPAICPAVAPAASRLAQPAPH
jgi:hypothetical protein